MSFERPAVNTLLRVDISPELSGVPSRVEGVDGDDLWIGAPSYEGNLEPVEPGSVLLLRWTGRRGLHALPVQVMGIEHSKVTLWRVLPVGDVEMVQRRAYVRAAVGDAVAVVPRDAVLRSVVGGWLIDLGEGGIRARFDASARIAEGDEVEVHLNLRGQDMVLIGCVLRLSDVAIIGGRKCYEAVVTFEPTETQGDIIRRTVLHEQVVARRKEQA